MGGAEPEPWEVQDQVTQEGTWEPGVEEAWWPLGPGEPGGLAPHRPTEHSKLGLLPLASGHGSELRRARCRWERSWNQSLSFLVLHCVCVSIVPVLRGLSRWQIILSRRLWVGNPGPGPPRRLQSSCRPGLWSHLTAGLGADSHPSSSGGLGGLGPLSLEPMHRAVPHRAAGFPHEWEREPKVFCKLISEETPPSLLPVPGLELCLCQGRGWHGAGRTRRRPPPLGSLPLGQPRC